MKLFNFLLFFFLLQFNFFNAQTETTGTIILDSNLSVKLDKDITNSQIIVTLVGPSDRWFSIALNAQMMLASNTDCLVMTSDTQFSDMYLPGGHNAPVFDATDDWTLVSNNVNTNLRTIVATRKFSTGDIHDFTFTELTNNLNFIWAYSSIPGYELLGHGGDNYGGGIFVFSNLGIENFNISSIKIFPNPSNDFLNVCTNTSDLKLISISDCLGKIIYSNEFSSNDYSVNISNFESGLYFITLLTRENKNIFKFIKN
jgi:hypothetical protein